MMRHIAKTSICNDYEKDCERCGKTFIIHLFAGVSKKEAEQIYKYCPDCSMCASYTKST